MNYPSGSVITLTADRPGRFRSLRSAMGEAAKPGNARYPEPFPTSIGNAKRTDSLMRKAIIEVDMSCRNT
jgi:hypothetical protein